MNTLNKSSFLGINVAGFALLSCLFCLLLCNSTIYAGEGDGKGFRFGLKAQPGLAGYSPEDIKKIAKKEMNLSLGWGLMMEFRFSETVSFATGFQLDRDRGSVTFIKPPDTNYVGYFVNVEQKIVSNDTKTIDSTMTAYALSDRKYKANYATLPLLIKMSTKEFSAMKIFGVFGAHLSILTSAVADDEVQKITVDSLKKVTLGAKTSFKDMDVYKDVQLFRTQLSVGAGMEYNVAGSTSLVVSFNYLIGVTNNLAYATGSNSEQIRTISASNLAKTDTRATTPFETKAVLNNFALTVGVLF